MLQVVSKFIFTKLLGWKLIGIIPKELRKFVLIGVPHTSWHDFYIAALFREYVNRKIQFVAKRSLFRFPFGYFFRWMGGVPVDRTKSNNLVDAIVTIFNQKEEFILAISPEGTRKKVSRWRTGFYHIAKNANVPVVMMTFDYGKKQIKISKPYFMTDNKEADFSHFYSFYKGVVGKVPEFS